MLQENHRMMLQENHRMMLQENHRMMLQENHRMMLQENHRMMLQENHRMMLQENHRMMLQESHRMMLQENHRMMLQENHHMMLQENHHMMLQENHRMMLQESHRMIWLCGGGGVGWQDGRLAALNEYSRSRLIILPDPVALDLRGPGSLVLASEGAEECTGRVAGEKIRGARHRNQAAGGPARKAPDPKMAPRSHARSETWQKVAVRGTGEAQI
ncbi:hypothetical protein NDU88_007350 [Pleurodeles waltl]|uniref:Uncharacterized protein n=1 Tax=Pleurodeles waltl TaxID=8319 RepID=A0AAV7MMQ2_PLEWA|nr:hypothetical protein NDU88_007350 [Pleurodeles waltl]